MLIPWQPRHLHWRLGLGGICHRIGAARSQLKSIMNSYNPAHRLIRHPTYAAILGMFVGSTIVSGQVSALFRLTGVGLLYRRKILLEETNLRRAFGSANDSYRNQMGALLPKLRVSGQKF